jgi:glycosyltransferase 2 family protein
MGLAWAAGLIFIPAPAGAGVRDAVLVATFAPLIGTTAAFAVALASRVLLLVADVVLALAGAVALGRRRKPQATGCAGAAAMCTRDRAASE